MKNYDRLEIKFHSFLTLALGGGEWSASRFREGAPCSHWIGGLVGSIANLNTGAEIRSVTGIEPRLYSL
jgi:hypothetical protein